MTIGIGVPQDQEAASGDGSLVALLKRVRTQLDGVLSIDIGAPVTGEALEAGGTGLLGWLSSVRKAVSELEDRAAVVIPISYSSATGTLATIAAPAMILGVYIVRTTAWNGAPTLQIGKAGTADWLVDNAKPKLSTALPAGEAAGVEVVEVNAVVTIDTPIVATWDQGGATAGAGYIVITWVALS